MIPSGAESVTVAVPAGDSPSIRTSFITLAPGLLPRPLDLGALISNDGDWFEDGARTLSQVEREHVIATLERLDPTGPSRPWEAT